MPDINSSWGRYPPSGEQASVAIHSRFDSIPDVDGTMLPRGNGRSYGDTCLNPGGVLLQMRGLDRFIAFDAETGVLRCEAGVLLADIIALALPRGWFLPVTPGTRFVTVGGAIANDVHGKNHHCAGSFGDHVVNFGLRRSTGEYLECSRTTQQELFAATIGGLGLTGMIVWAELRLRRVRNSSINESSQRFAALEGFFDLSAANVSHEYTVAWIDCLAKGRSLGRGVFYSGDHLERAPCDREPPPPRQRPSIPFDPPFAIINPLSLKAFNEVYFRRASTKPRHVERHFLSFFYPLDAIPKWNRMYGRKGFLQYQCVLPPAVARDALRELLSRISLSGQGSFLAVLKEFGARTAPGLLSFARPGTTLALDFPNAGAKTLKLLDELDHIVAEAGGALYPAKDARMPPHMFRLGYPRLEAFRQHLDPRLSSGFWRRITQ